jgi:hypothetical protein
MIKTSILNLRCFVVSYNLLTNTAVTFNYHYLIIRITLFILLGPIIIASIPV